MKYYVVISENKGGEVLFDDLIIKHFETIEEAKAFVLETVNPMIDGYYNNTDDLAEALVFLEDEIGYAPLFEINEIKY